MAEFLLELGLEEVPARMLAAAERELGNRVAALLRRERLLGDDADAGTYSTPRRLAVRVQGVRAQQPDATQELTGPAWAVAFKEGAPTPAAHAFAKKAQVEVDALRKIANAKGEYVGATLLEPGQPAAAVLAKLLPAEIAAIAWPKPMYWRAGKPERFVRPVQWILSLLDGEVVPAEFAGVQAGRLSRGHRILHGPAPVVVERPAVYVEAMRDAYVTVDVAERRNAIRKGLDRVTRTVRGARWREDEDLVETVTHLTECPQVLLGSFDAEFLHLPQEVLVTVMRDHQKYFAVEDAEGRLLPYFLAVLNTRADAEAEAVIRHGNERVLRARFSDAQFFWKFDGRVPLAARAQMLEAVTFHKDLGNYAKKTERNLAVAKQLATATVGHGGVVNEAALEQAVLLAKVDLTTELVKEFTELQGIVGGLYMRREAPEDAVAAEAVYWQYMPASMQDAIPPTMEGQLLGVADRIATLTDLFALGLAPTGSRDPYALRRAANAVVKILAQGGTLLLLPELVEAAVANASQAESLLAFLRERTSFYMREAADLPPDVVAAVLATEAADVPDALRRGEALKAVRGSEDFAAIAAAWKRMKNILKQAAEKQFSVAASVDPNLLADEAERALWQALQPLTPELEVLRAKGDYTVALERIASLRPAVDRFFDTVMVMAEDAAVRANRLALLRALTGEVGRLADFSEIAPAAAAE